MEEKKKAPIAHQSYLCSSLHGKDAPPQKIYPQRISELLGSAESFIIPIFQRRYVWEEKQWVQLWKDINSSRSMAALGHHIGKMILIPVAEGIMCLDGQQRIITCLLIIAAVRDALHAMKEEPAELVEQVQGWLFNANGKTKLKPSALDAKAYYDAIGIKEDFDFVEVAPNPNIVAAKHFFDKHIRTLWKQQEMGGIRRFLRQLTKGLSCIRVDLDASVNAQDCFLWFQEKSLMGAVLMHVRAPGKNFSSMDLIRNYVLSFYLDVPWEQQKAAYTDLWIPCERRLCSPPGYGNRIKSFVERLDIAVEGEDPVGPPPLPIPASFRKMADFSQLDLYYGFVRIVERRQVAEKMQGADERRKIVEQVVRALEQ